jgi:uncharacterized protein (DUF488 family)
MKLNKKIVLNSKQLKLLEILLFFRNSLISRLKLFKISFLLDQAKIYEKFYDFVPYKFGPYSFEMEKDINFLYKLGLINILENKISINKESLSFLKKMSDENYLNFRKYNFLNWQEGKLLDYIYNKYPYYTQNSLIKKNNFKPLEKKQTIKIYTIGYEGRTIDNFINTLIKNDIKAIIDVRSLPFSNKYGFNKYWFLKYLKEFKIDYYNMPDLGIPKIIRMNGSKEEYFNWYKNYLINKTYDLKKVIFLIKLKPSCLMCFEKDFNDCHRGILAKKLKEITGLEIEELV